jgi:hypothetical protein
MRRVANSTIIAAPFAKTVTTLRAITNMSTRQSPNFQRCITVKNVDVGARLYATCYLDLTYDFLF